MSLWTIEPRDPLVVRDGRPNNERSESATLPFPYPGTVAGIVRTRLGSDEQGTFTAHHDLAALLRVKIRGPLLARLGEGSGFYVPSPRDAVSFGKAAPRTLRRLCPMKRPAGALFDGDFTCDEPVGLAPEGTQASEKPGEPPAFWPWHLFERWLSTPAGVEGEELFRDALGPLEFEERMHVKLTDTWTAEDGKLFETRGLRFATKDGKALALAIDVDDAKWTGRPLQRGVAPAFGERRLVRWESAPTLSLPSLPVAVRDALRGKDACVRVRVVLLTPAIFEAGWKPGSAKDELLGTRSGITPRLVAACVPRPDTISGWDFAKREPKKTRRLVKAGSVYWLDLEGTAEQRVAWADDVMMTNVSDLGQDRADGFGLAAVGVGA